MDARGTKQLRGLCLKEPGDIAMKKQNRDTIELSAYLTNLNSYGRGLNLPQSPNCEEQTRESQDNQPVCNNGVCETNLDAQSSLSQLEVLHSHSLRRLALEPIISNN